MYENQLRKLGTDNVVAPRVDLAAHNSHARLKGAGHASASDLSVYLCVSLRAVPEVLKEQGIKTNRAGRTDWSDVWEKLWYIPDVPAAYHDIMRKPLLTIEEVADRVGVSARSILRDGDRARTRYGLPRHVQLSPRRRRYHPEMIHLWEMDLPLEDWMRAVNRRPRVGLQPRLSQNNSP
jgi:hypothetical protein